MLTHFRSGCMRKPVSGSASSKMSLSASACKQVAKAYPSWQAKADIVWFDQQFAVSVAGQLQINPSHACPASMGTYDGYPRA